MILDHTAVNLNHLLGFLHQKFNQA